MHKNLKTLSESSRLIDFLGFLDELYLLMEDISTAC